MDTISPKVSFSLKNRLIIKYFFATNSSQKQTYYWPKKSKKYLIIRHDLIDLYVWPRLKYIQFWTFFAKRLPKVNSPSNSAFLSSTFLTFCQKITSISHFWPKKLKKYSLNKALFERIYFSNRTLLSNYRVLFWLFAKKTHSLNPKAVNLSRFSLLMRGGIRNKRFESSLLPTHPPTYIITENLFIAKSNAFLYFYRWT